MALPTGYTKEEKPKLPGRYTTQKFGEFPKMKIRILSDFIEGKSVWGEKDGKPYPYRVRPEEAMPVKNIGINKFKGGPNKVLKFFAAVCYNITTKQVEIFEFVEGGVQEMIVDALWELEKDSDWGDLKQYDITITRSGEKTKMRFQVTPSNKVPFANPLMIGQASQVDLEQLYIGGNPFEHMTTASEPMMSDEDVEDINDGIPF